MMKFCKDCKWSTDLGGTFRNPTTSQWVCSNERVGSKIDVVDGERLYKDCHVARAAGVQDLPCGHEGRLWEKRA